jgi:hypothetical protein
MYPLWFFSRPLRALCGFFFFILPLCPQTGDSLWLNSLYPVLIADYQRQGVAEDLPLWASSLLGVLRRLRVV